MWSNGCTRPLSPTLTDPSFRPWREMIPPHDLETHHREAAGVKAIGMVLGTVLGMGLCLIVLLAEVLVIGGLWLYRRARRGYGAWWHTGALILMLTGLLTGCQDMVRATAALNGYKGDIYASDCQPGSLQAGYCIHATRKDTP
jgi:hypothetical protein